MASYYYLAAQLPYLVFGQKPPMSSAAFRELARPLLSEGDAAFLELVALDPGEKADAAVSAPSYAEAALPSGSEFIDRWREWERSLRLNLARQRAQKTKREAGAPVDPPLFPADAAQAALKAAADGESPLAAEFLLDRARWDAVESFQGINAFDSGAIFAYLLKLLLLERHGAFTPEEGLAEYNTLYASIMEGAQTGSSPAGEFK